jgi:glycosyltransferase involved in cell wall biosynthesis
MPAGGLPPSRKQFERKVSTTCSLIMDVHNAISAVLPARNEASTVARVVRVLLDHHAVGEVLLIDNGSSDGTGEIAARIGARVMKCEEIGLGRAMKLGLRSVRCKYVLRTDADIDNWDPAWIDKLLPLHAGILKRAVFTSPYNQNPVDNLVVRPFFQLYRPIWDSVPLPTTGTYLFDKESFPVDALPDDWAIDIAILLRGLSCDAIQVINVDIGLLSDKPRHIGHYVPMARDLNRFLTRYFKSEVISSLRSAPSTEYAP